LGDSGFSDHSGAARAVGCDGAVVSVQVSLVHVAQSKRTGPGAGAADGPVAKAFHGTGDEFAVEAGADENGYVVVTEVPSAGEQAAVPEGVYRWWRSVKAQGCAGVSDVFEAERYTKEANGSACKTGDYGEGEALLQVVSGGHFVQFTYPVR
jgi:hypothetical protein